MINDGDTDILAANVTTLHPRPKKERYRQILPYAEKTRYSNRNHIY